MALKHTGTVELNTERLLLRKCTPEDAPQMYANWQSDPQVTKYLTWNHYTDPEASRIYANRLAIKYADPGFYDWLITLNGEPIGAIGVVRMDDENLSGEIGYCLGRKWWGRGIMPEALRAVIGHMFDVVGMHRLAARHDVRNPNSGRVMEKCGMQYEGTLRQAVLRKDGSMGDIRLYGMVNSGEAQAWPGR